MPFRIDDRSCCQYTDSDYVSQAARKRSETHHMEMNEASIGVNLTEEQLALVQRPISGDTLFLEGPAGVGKTTVAARRLLHLVISGVPAEQILVLTPQRTLLTPYLRVLRSADFPPGGTVDTPPARHGAG